MRWLVPYYLATPLFAALDLLLHFPVRVAGLTSPAQRIAYYLALLALGGLCRARPRIAPWVGMAESSVNLLLLLLSILLPIWSLPEAVLEGAEPMALMTGPRLANALLAGMALIVSFQRDRMSAMRRPGGDPRSV